MFTDQIVSLGSTVIFTLPIFESPTWQSFTVRAFDGSIPLTPSNDYVSFDSVNGILTFAPTTVSQIGSKNITIFASDGVLTSDYFFYVLCKTLPQF